jgi:hypothetical protein
MIDDERSLGVVDPWNAMARWRCRAGFLTPWRSNWQMKPALLTPADYIPSTALGPA